MKSDEKLNIRGAKIEDFNSIMILTKELGYEITEIEVKNKLDRINNNETEKVLVAEYDQVIGWMHLSLVEPLESKSFVEIRGIVVKKEYRNRGIGTELISNAEEWADEMGCEKIRIRMNVKRLETRMYYQNLNFVSIKKQEVFEKEL